MDAASRRWIKTGIGLLIIVLLFSQSGKEIHAQDVQSHKNILILNSYHPALTWTKEETEGITDTLMKNELDLSISVEYVDWKNYPTDENLRLLTEYYQYKYRNKPIDLLITTDDAALKFALEYRKELFSNAAVVFSGVNQESASLLTKGYDNCTGVLEVVDPTETIAAALKINPAIRKVHVLFDNSESGVSTGKLVMEKIHAAFGELQTIPLNTLSYTELMNHVKGIGPDGMLLVTTYYSDGRGNIVEFEKASREVGGNSSVPVYHLYDMGLNHGAIGGSMLSGKLQGEGAAGLALRILQGEHPGDIPVAPAASTRNVFDYNQLMRFGISLDKIPAHYEIVNKPFSFLETYRTLVLGVLAAFAVLIALLLVLLFYIRKTGKMRRELSASHEELTQIYEELTASDEELRQQFDEILSYNEKIKEAETEYFTLAYHDALTGLPNKTALSEAVHELTVQEQGKFAVMYVDIDHFKYINDTMGHAFGDRLILGAGERLRSVLTEECRIYRLSGDEFVIVVRKLPAENGIEELASQLLDRFKEEFCIQNSVIHISLSIGIALYPNHGIHLDELLKHADIAMYKAKDSGRNQWVVYDPFLNKAFNERAVIEKYLYKASEKNEIDLYYQPQLDLRTNRITGLEALLRWNSPELGPVPPATFIKVAEDTHLIIPLGEWVLRKACAFLAQLHQNGHRELSMSVNISILQLMQTDFTDLVLDALEQSELEPDALELEITETMLMQSFGAIHTKLKLLRERGVRIALDDFGKGYSSLSYLKQLPITTIKIDKSFIDHVTGENRKDNLTGHIIGIGKSLGISVVAEGVETQEQLDYLIRHECQKIQGFLFSRPVTGRQIIKMLEESPHGTVWSGHYSI